MKARTTRRPASTRSRTADERTLVTIYRTSSPIAQRSILAHARLIDGIASIGKPPSPPRKGGAR